MKTTKKILLIDNNDSFTYNIVDYLRRIEGIKLEVFKTSLIKISKVREFNNIIISSGLVKLRFFYDQKNFSLEFSTYTLRPITTLKIVEANHIEYPLKFTDRKEIEELFEKRDNCDDILIVKNYYITDTSIANIVFWNGERWITPSTPLLRGTTRARLLKEKRIIEEPIKLSDLSKFKAFSIINAMRDTISGLPITNIV